MKVTLPKLGMMITGATLIGMALVPVNVGAAAPDSFPLVVPTPTFTVPPTPTIPAPTAQPPTPASPQAVHANIIVRKTASAQTLALGATVTFDISITCDGQSACGRVGVGDAVPDAFSVVSAVASRGNAQTVGNNVTWGVDLMQPREVIHITIVAKSLKTGCVCNIAQGNAEFPNKTDDDRSQACVCVATPLPKTGGEELPLATAMQVIAGLGLIGAGLFARGKKVELS